ncbi:hypothetical protein LJC55_00400 [Eubacteriales bacterium OttesenSCG-928-N14]|nr:hypothetical protein [Eubacteriales bacterium OttesenSCG-928-N14]
MKQHKTLPWQRRLLLLCALAFCIALPLVSVFADYEPGETGIIDAAKNKDIYVNVDADMLSTLSSLAGESISSEKLSEDIRNYLLDKDPDYNEANIRVRSNVAIIDTTDLSSWYVFDHYDDGQGSTTNYGGINKATTGFYAPDDEIFTNKRKYYQVRELYSYTADNRSGSTINVPFSEVIPLGELATNGTQYGMSTDTSLAGLNTGYRSYNVRKLREHIYSYADGDGAHMIFMGYGGNMRAGASASANYNYLTDFLFYPAVSPDEKSIEFDIKSDNVRTHSMAGAGFLVNCGIEEREESSQIVQYIHGYMLYIKFWPLASDYAPTHADMYLYKINPNVKVDDFHDRMASSSSKLATDSSYVTLIGTCRGSYKGNVSGVANNQYQPDENADTLFRSDNKVKSSMHLRIVFDDENFAVYASDSKGAAETQAVFTYYADGNMANNAAGNVSKTRDTFETDYYGFGPLVDYSGQGHTCATTSVYRFTNLEMYFKVDVFSALLDTEFHNSQNTDRFFVNLVSQQIDESNADFWDGIARLRGEQIFYVTNAPNGVIGDSMPNRNNGLYLEPGVDYTTYEEFVQLMGDYFYNPGNWQVDSLPPMNTQTPYASFNIVGRDKYLESGDASIVLEKVEQQRMPSAPVTVYLQDRSMVAPPSTISTLNITIIAPDETETELSLPYTGQNEEYELFTLNGSTTQIGKYTVRMEVVAVDGSGQNPVTSVHSIKYFEVIQDTIAPTVAIKASDLGKVNDDGVYEGNSINLQLGDVGWGVVAYHVGYGADENNISYVTQDYVPLGEMWAEYPLNIPTIGARNENLYVKVWDWVGNLYLYELPVNPRVLGIAINSANAYITIPAGTFDAVLDGAYITGEVVALPDATDNLYTSGEFKVVGFATTQNATTALEEITMSGNQTLYPVVRDIVKPSAAIDTDDLSNIAAGTYRGAGIIINLADAGAGLGQYQIGYGKTDDAVTYGSVNSLSGQSSYAVEIGTLPSGIQNLYIKVTDAHGNETVFKLAINARVNQLVISKDNAYDVDLTDHNYPAITEKYIIGEVISAPSITGYETVDGYQLIGFNTNKTATSGQANIAINAATVTIYPILSDVAAPTITLTPTREDTYVEQIDLAASISDNNAVANRYCYLVEYSCTDTVPSSLTPSEIEQLVGSGWNSFTGSSICYENELTSGKQYLVLVKATDASGNTGYALSRPYGVDTVAPTLKIGSSVISTAYEAYLSTSLVVADDFTQTADLLVSYTRNGGDSVTIADPSDILLTPPATGSDVYVFTIADDAGNSITRTITLHSYKELLSVLDDLDADNVNSANQDDLDTLTDAIEQILGAEDAATGATTEQLQQLEDALDIIEDLLQVIEDTEKRLEDAANAIQDVEFDQVGQDARDDLESALEDAKDLLGNNTDNLTDDERQALEDLIEKLEDIIGKIDADTDLERITGDGLALDDRDALDEMIDNYEKILERDDLTEQERADVTDKLEQAKDLDETLSQVEDYIDNYTDIVDKSLEDLAKEDYPAAIDAYETWQDLTDEQKELIAPGKVDETEAHLESLSLKATADGRKSTELELGSDAIKDATVDNLDALFGDAKVFTTADEKLVEQGGHALIKVVIQTVQQGLNATEQALLEDTLNQDKDKVVQLIDISLFKIHSDRKGAVTDTVLVHETSEPLRIVIPLNAAQQRHARLRIYRIHDGKVELLPDLDSSRATYTIETHLFSSYAMVYDASLPPTGDDAMNTAWMLTTMLSLICIIIMLNAIAIEAKRRRG